MQVLTWTSRLVQLIHLQKKFYSGLQALALQEDEPEPVDDLLEPDYDGLKKFDNVMNHFRKTFYDGE